MRRYVKSSSFIEYMLAFGAVVIAIVIGAKRLGDRTESQLNKTEQIMGKADTLFKEAVKVED